MSAGKMAAAILERLEALSCPPVLGLSPLAPPEALALLSRPSGRRRELLLWLCARISPPLGAHLKSLPEDAQMREMADLGAQLMLCEPDDLALVQGTAPPEQQLQFLQDLLDAVPPPETAPENRPPKAIPFLLKLLESREGRAALRRPHLPPLPVELSETPPRPRRPLPELKAELGRVRWDLEELQAKVSNLGGSPPPESPDLGVLAGAFASLAADFGASGLGDTPGPPRTLPVHPSGARAPAVGRGLRGLRQALETLTQLRAGAGAVTQLEGVVDAIRSQIPPLSRRFQIPVLNQPR